MGWTGVVTDGGNALMARWQAGGGTLTIDGITVGSGNTPEINLRRATQLAEYKTDGAIGGYAFVDIDDGEGGTAPGAQIQAQVEAATATVGEYTAKEIGIWAHLGQEASILFALHQSAEGVPIPLKSITPNFAFRLYCEHAIGNNGAGQLVVNVTGGALVTQTQLEETSEEIWDKIGDSEMGTTAETLTGAIAEHSQEIAEANENISKLAQGGVWETEEEDGEMILYWACEAETCPYSTELVGTDYVLYFEDAED